MLYALLSRIFWKRNEKSRFLALYAQDFCDHFDDVVIEEDCFSRRFFYKDFCFCIGDYERAYLFTATKRSGEWVKWAHVADYSHFSVYWALHKMYRETKKQAKRKERLKEQERFAGYIAKITPSPRVPKDIEPIIDDAKRLAEMEAEAKNIRKKYISFSR